MLWADLQVRDGVIEIRAIRRNPREGWADDARRLAEQGGDALVWPEHLVVLHLHPMSALAHQRDARTWRMLGQLQRDSRGVEQLQGIASRRASGPDLPASQTASRLAMPGKAGQVFRSQRVFAAVAFDPLAHEDDGVVALVLERGAAPEERAAAEDQRRIADRLKDLFITGGFNGCPAGVGSAFVVLRALAA